MEYIESLERFTEIIEYDFSGWKSSIINQKWDHWELGRFCIECSDTFRRIAIIEFLNEKVNVQDRLIESGLVRLEFLNKCTNDSEFFDDPCNVAGKYEPLLDAIASGDFDLAKKIIAITPKEPIGKFEHIGDFYYACVIACLLTSDNDLDKMLHNFCNVDEKQLSTRQECAKALVLKDQELFDTAFQNLVSEQQKLKGVSRIYDIEKFYESLQDEEFEPGDMEAASEIIEHGEKKIFIEGLALLQLANIRGLKVADEYQLCPKQIILLRVE